MELECSDCDSCIDDTMQFEPSGTSGESSDSDEEEELGQGDNEQLSQLSWSDKNIQVYIYILIILLKVFMSELSDNDICTKCICCKVIPQLKGYLLSVQTTVWIISFTNE